jgi:hypothetical protein
LKVEGAICQFSFRKVERDSPAYSGAFNTDIIPLELCGKLNLVTKRIHPMRQALLPDQ